jgi:GDPmannose 4,6-dehydratase
MARIHRPQQTALVCGISGQDGAYLAAHLLDQGYRVVGTSRDPASCDRRGLAALGLAALGLERRVAIKALDPSDLEATVALLEAVRPDELYNLSGQSSIALSFEQPAATFQSIAGVTVNLLEAVRVTRLPTRLFFAGSTAMFGDNSGEPVDESTALRPGDPYALAKSAAFSQVDQYRRLHGVWACTGILSNHESPLRSERFVTQKITAAACRIAAGDTSPLALGDLSVERDWGWAPEYVVAMHAMLQLKSPEDLVVATGVSVALETFVAEAFACLGLDWRRHVVCDERFLRRDESRRLRANPSRAAERLGWRAETTIGEVARKMVEARLFRDQAAVRRAA